MATTPTFGWPTPDDTDLVRDGAAAIRAFGDAVDSTFGSDARIASFHSATKTDTFTLSNTPTYTVVPDLEVTFTPASATNLLVVSGTVPLSTSAGSGTRGAYLAPFKGGSNLVVPDSPASRIPSLVRSQYSTNLWPTSGIVWVEPTTFVIVAEAGSTSPLTVDVRVRTLGTSADTLYINRSSVDADLDSYIRGIATLTVTEIEP